ncbi:MAG: hypothetical protein R3F28_13600 [Candidatus Kapaibacterium sp.]
MHEYSQILIIPTSTQKQDKSIRCWWSDHAATIAAGGSYPLIQDYTYDGISQLTEWKKQYGGIYGWTRELYAYDPVGNRDSLTYIANGWSTPIRRITTTTVVDQAYRASVRTSC